MDQLLFTPRPSNTNLWLLSDKDFLSQLDWERTSSVPAALRKAAREGKVAQVSKQLQSRLGKYVGGKPGRSKSHSIEQPAVSALWSRPAFDESVRSEELVQIRTSISSTTLRPRGRVKQARNGRTKAGSRGKLNSKAPLDGVALRLMRWLDAFDPSDPLLPLEQLLLAELLRDAGPHLPADLFFRIWRTLLSSMFDSAALAEQNRAENDRAAEPGEDEASSAVEDPNEEPLRDATPDQQLIAEGELPWVMGLLFSDLAASRRWREDGKQVLRRTLLDQTDHNGFPRAALLERLAFWMAPLVRAREWAAACRQQLWNAEAENRFRRLACSAASLCRTDGRLSLSNGFVAGAVDLLTSASKLAGVTKDAPPAAFLRALDRHLSRPRGGLRSGIRRKRRRTARTLTKFPGAQSDWAQLACLRSGWSVDADSLVVAHHETMPQLELAGFGRSLLNGPWDIRLSLDGTPLSFTREWACVCWYSDADADYLELKTEHSAGVRIERQILLARDDNFALFAETVAAPKGMRVECVSRLPLAHGGEILPDSSTRECRLKAPGIAARAFAPMLPCERVEGTPGYFGAAEKATSDSTLELRQVATGGLYAAIVIDWNPSRRRSYADWRKLTVTEDGRVLPPDIANGCRLRIGDDQWVFYRSLERSVMGRAILGHHTHNETVIGRFDSDGDIDPILLVEYPEESSTTA